MSDSDFPTFTDGRKAPRQPVVKWWNRLSSSLPILLTWLDDDIKTEGYSVDHKIDSTGQALGGFTGASIRAGSINIQIDDVSSPIPLPGHIISVAKGSITNWYTVKDTSAPFKGKEQVRLSMNVRRIVNPFFTLLLSEDEGDTYRVTHSKAAGVLTITANPVNTRSGATLLCELTGINDTLAVPAGLSINATSGVITVTGATIAVGVYDLDVTCQDTLANKTTNKGGNRLVLTVTA